MAKPTFIRIRIAVVVDENGYWSAVGNCAYDNETELVDAANDYLPEESSPNRHVIWLEADVPTP